MRIIQYFDAELTSGPAHSLNAVQSVFEAKAQKRFSMNWLEAAVTQISSYDAGEGAILRRFTRITRSTAQTAAATVLSAAGIAAAAAKSLLRKQVPQRHYSLWLQRAGRALPQMQRSWLLLAEH